jgi:hypothetical protein
LLEQSLGLARLEQRKLEKSFEAAKVKIHSVYLQKINDLAAKLQSA